MCSNKSEQFCCHYLKCYYSYVQVKFTVACFVCFGVGGGGGAAGFCILKVIICSHIFKTITVLL